MATRKIKTTETVEPQEVSKALAANPMEQPERMRLSEMGYSGMSIFSGITQDEMYRELTFPNSLKTYKKMSYHTSINSCLNLYDNLISKVTWRVVPPPNATEKEKQEAEFINQCLQDMQTPLRRVVKDALSSNIYGFSVLEKVFYRRTNSNGSLYNDGKIGIKKIAHRNQESIKNFVFSADGNDVIGVKQSLAGANGNRYTQAKTDVVIPRNKFILVTAGRNREDPYGVSPLRDAWLSYTYLVLTEEAEATGLQKDLAGTPLLRIPATYLSADASPEQKQLYEGFKNIVRNIQVNNQSGLILPSDQSQETKSYLFDFELIPSQGNGKTFATDKIKQYFQNQIYTSLGADVLLLGSSSSSGGSYALATVKNTLTGTRAEAMLDGLVECFNQDLIKHLYELNGMDATRMCTLDYENLHAPDLDMVSRFIQRTKAVGALPMTHDVVNYVLGTIGLDPLDETANLTELLGESTSRSGDSLNTSSGGLNGTAEKVSEQDNSSANLENA